MGEDGRGQGLGQGLAENSPECPAVEDDEDDGFSFPLPSLATGACIVPVYPVFGRPSSPRALAVEEKEEEAETATLRVLLGRLLLEERGFRARQPNGRSISARQRQEEGEEDDDDDDDDEASAGAGQELEGVPPESYCLWAPASLRRCRKSGSTGSVLRWRRVSGRHVGRSHSDGKEMFVFLNAPGGASRPRPGSKQEEGSNGDPAGGADRPLRCHGRGGAGGSGRRRSYLPYKHELIGLFANVSGLRRSYHPF